MISADQRQGSSVISLLIVAAIIGVIYWSYTQMSRPSTRDSTLMKDANIDTSSYKSMIDSARKVAEDASKEKQ